MTRLRRGTQRTWTKLLVYGLLGLLALQFALHSWTNVSEGGAGGCGRLPGVQSSAVVGENWYSLAGSIYIYGQSLMRKRSTRSLGGRSMRQWRKDRRMMKATKKRFLSRCNWCLGAMVAAVAAVATFATILKAPVMHEMIDDPQIQKQEDSCRSEFYAQKDLLETLAQIHGDDAGLAGLPEDCEMENAPKKVLQIQNQITQTLSEEAASLEPTEWFDSMEKKVKHLGACELLTFKGASCTEPCCMLSQLQQEFSAEEWPMVVQVVHQAYAKAVDNNAEKVGKAEGEWSLTLKRLQTGLQSYETTQNRQSVVKSETLEALEKNDLDVLMDEKLFGKDLPDINLLRSNEPTCRRGCQSARATLIQAASSVPTVDPNNAEHVKFRLHRSVALSELKQALNNITPKIVTIVCPYTIYVDCDLHLPGASFAVQAGCVEIRQSCTLNLDGAGAAEPEGKPSKAKDATEKGQHEMHGDPGIGGKDGAPGGSGGHFYCHARISAVGDAKWTVHCAGAKGGKGQDGGDGGNGRAATKGADASIPGNFTECAFAQFCFGKPATPGGNAGAKGPGGKGGEGGYHGESDVSAFGASCSAIFVQPSSSQADEGPSGKPGKPGIPGLGAAHGKNKGVIKKVNQSEDRKEGADLRMKVNGNIVSTDYYRKFTVTRALNMSWQAVLYMIFTGGILYKPPVDDCREAFYFAQGISTTSVQGTVPQTSDVQSKHRQSAVHAAGVPKQQLQHDLVAEVQEGLKTWPSNELLSLAQDLSSAYGCNINLPGQDLQGSRAEALKQAVNRCAEQIQERHCEEVQASLTQQQILVSADYRNDCCEATLAPVAKELPRASWSDEWPQRCGDFGSPVWKQVIVTSDRPLLQMAVDGFHLSPSMSNLVKLAKALEKDDEEVPDVVANLQLAASMPDLFRLSDAEELLQGTVDSVRNEAAEVAYRFRTENEQEMMCCLMALETERPSKVDLLKLKLETLGDRALHARARIGVEGSFSDMRDMRSLQNLMTFEEGKTFTDMREAGRLLLQLVPFLSPQEPLGPWHENYRLFRQSGGVFEPEAVVTCVEHILSLPQLPDETLQVVLVDLMCEVLQLTATQMEQQDPLWATSLKLIAEKPQVLGPVGECLRLLVSCQKGENIALTRQEQEDVIATVDEDARRIYKELALASQEMCGRQLEDCFAILKDRHEKATEYLRKVVIDDQVFSDVASCYVGAFFKLRRAVMQHWPQWGLLECRLQEPSEDELHSAQAELNQACHAWRIRVGQPQQQHNPECSVPFMDAGWNLTTVQVKTADFVRTCRLQEATLHLLPSKTAQQFRFGVDVETQRVDCRLEARYEDEEWVEVWQDSVDVAGKQSPWISLPPHPALQKTLQFRYIRLGDADASDADANVIYELEGQTLSLEAVPALRSRVNTCNIFDFQAPYQVTALRIPHPLHIKLLPSLLEVSLDGEKWCTLEVGHLDNGWQLLYFYGLPLDPVAAAKKAEAELRAVEAKCFEQLKDYSSKVQNFVDQAVEVLEGEQPWCRWLDVLVDVPFCMLETLPQVAEFLVANHLYRWCAPGTPSSADKAIEAYNTSNRKVLKTLLLGGRDDMADLFAAHLKVAEHCTEDADVDVWLQNHAKAKLSVQQAEASRALCWKDNVDPLIKDVILEKWQETLTQNHGLDGFCLPRFLFQEAAAVSLANAKQPEDFCSLVLQKFLDEEEVKKRLPGILLNELQTIGQKDSLAAARFCLAIHESLMTAQECDSNLFSEVVVETTSSPDEVTEVHFEIGGETIPFKKGGDDCWSFSGPKAFCVSFNEPQELTALCLVVKAKDPAETSKAKVRVWGCQDDNTWMELASKGECGAWLKLRPGKTSKVRKELEIWEFSVMDPEIGGGPALVQTALAGGKEALKAVISLLGSCSSSAHAAAAIASQPWNWTAWMGAMSCLEIEQLAKGLSEEERNQLLMALNSHPPAVAVELFLGYQRDVQELGGKGACPLRVWPQLTGALQRLRSSEMILETFRGERCRNWPSTLQAILLEERLERYANAHPHQDLENIRDFADILQTTFGGLGVVNCLDLMEQKPDEGVDPVRSDAKFLALVWKWRMSVDQVVAGLRTAERADWRLELEAMRSGGARAAEELVELMEIAASCDADKSTIRKALKLVQDSRHVHINSMPVGMLQKKHIEEWMRTARDNGKDWVLNHMPEVMAVVREALKLAMGKQPYDSQLLPLALMMQGQRLALQCLTGEGKQLVLALFSAFRALLFKDGYLIVLTSDAGLASRDPDELKPFYDLVGLRVGHNVSEVQVRKQTYQDVDVVYAHLPLLLTDYLLTEVFHQAVLPEAQHTWEDTCILDELDKLCTDEASNTLYLAQDIAGLEHCESILVNAFAAGQCISSEEVLKEVEAELKKSLQNGSIACPKSMEDFAVRRLPRWLRSVLVSLQMREGGNFILRDPKGDETSGPQPITMDLPSGKEQWSVRLSDGLQQFLSLQYDCYVDAESLRSVFMSPVTFFKKVKEFFGVTGTLGGDHDRDFLRGVFDVGLFDVPPCLPKRVEEMDPVVAVNTDQWLEKVCEAAMASVQREQACLVVCQTNGEANDVYKTCKESYKGRVHLCAEEAHKQVTKLSPGDILVATNNCARGVNIKVDAVDSAKATELQGTLHVICTYWPGVREQTQIYGRTCRNGAHGSVQMVLLVPEAAEEERYLKPFLVLKLLMHGRLEQMADELWHLETVTLPRGECAASLFDEFRGKLQETWDKLKLKTRDDIVWKCVQNVLCADFAFWLDKKDEDLEKISSSNLEAEKKKLKAKLQEEVLTTWTGTPDDLVQRSYAESVRLAVSYLKDQGRAQEARVLLKKAIEKEEGSGFGYAQHLYMGAAILKLDGSEKSWPEARKHFDEAHVLFMKRQLEQAALAQVQSAVNGCAGRPCNGRYLQQTGDKAQLFAPHVSSTGKVCGADVGPDMFLMDVGTEDGMLWRSKQLYNALKEKNVIVEDKVRALAGKEPELKWLHASYADEVRKALNQKRSDEGRFTLEDCQSYAGSSSKVWKYLLEHGYLGQEKSSGFAASDELGSEQKEGLTEVDGGFIVDWGSSKAEEIQKFLRKKDANELDETKSAKCLDAFTNLLKDPLQKVWQGIMKESTTEGDDQPGHRAAVMALRRALQESQDTEDAKPLPDTALFKDDVLTECASYASATAEAVAEMLITILSSESVVVVLRNLPDPGCILHVRLHEEGVLLPPRINPKADLESAVKEIQGEGHSSEAGKWLKEAFLGEDSKNPILQRMEDAKGLFDTADSGAKIKVSFCHILDEMHQVPRDARGLEAAGLIHVVQFEEVKNISWSWGAFWVGIIGLAQVVLGAVLICCGWTQVGLALLSEGIGDIAFAINAGLTGSFSWRAYAMHKVVSVAISFATFCLGAIPIFKLGAKEMAKEMAKKGVRGVTMMAGKMLAEGAFFAAVDVGIDKLLEAARQSAMANSTDALRQAAQEKLKDLKKVLSQVILHFPDTAVHQITMIGKDALDCFAFEIAKHATTWAENIGSQLASKAKQNSKPAKYWKAVNIFLTAASFLTSLTALIVVLENFARTVKSKLEKLIKDKDEMSANEDIEHKVANMQETLQQLVVDKASSEVVSGMYGPAVKFAFRKATQHVAKQACSRVLKIQEKLQAKSKEVLPKAVEPTMAVKTKADKQKPPKKAEKVQPAMMPASPDEKTKERLQRENTWKQAIKNRKENMRNTVKELNNSRQGQVQGQKLQIELEMSSDLDLLKVPKDNSDGRCKVNFIPRTNTTGTTARYLDQLCKDSVVNKEKSELLKGDCQAQESKTKVMVQLHADNPKKAEECGRMKAHFDRGGPSLPYTTQLAKEQLYKKYYDNLFENVIIKNNDFAKEKYSEACIKVEDLENKKHSKNGLSDSDKQKLSQYKKQKEYEGNRKALMANVVTQFTTMDGQIRDRCKRTLNYQYLDSKVLDQFSFRNGKPPQQKAKMTGKAKQEPQQKAKQEPPLKSKDEFLSVCDKVLEHAKHEMKNGKFANYTVRGDFQQYKSLFSEKKEGHAVTFYILTHQENGKPVQTVHFSDSNRGDVSARAKNWSSLRDVPHAWLSRYDKFWSSIKFQALATESFAHGPKVNQASPSTLVKDCATLAKSGLPYDMTPEAILVTRLNEFPRPCNR